jgi:hypothetical protein
LHMKSLIFLWPGRGLQVHCCWYSVQFRIAYLEKQLGILRAYSGSYKSLDDACLPSLSDSSLPRMPRWPGKQTRRKSLRNANSEKASRLTATSLKATFGLLSALSAASILEKIRNRVYVQVFHIFSHAYWGMASISGWKSLANLTKWMIKILFGLKPQIQDPVPESALEPLVYHTRASSGKLGSLIRQWPWTMMTSKNFENRKKVLGSSNFKCSRIYSICDKCLRLFRIYLCDTKDRFKYKIANWSFIFLLQIRYDIFVNCIKVDTRWQQHSTHLYKSIHTISQLATWTTQLTNDIGSECAVTRRFVL